MKRADRKEKRQEEAKLRQEKHDKLTPIKKIAKLNSKLGKNIGAKKERTRPWKLINAAQPDTK